MARVKELLKQLPLLQIDHSQVSQSLWQFTVFPKLPTDK
jgi:hypothetical protein